MRLFEFRLLLGCTVFFIAAGAFAAASGATTETVIHNLSAADGGQPTTGLAVDASTGAFYGAANSPGGTLRYGAIYQLLPPTGIHHNWTHTVVYNNNSQDGENYIVAANGVVYASSSAGAVIFCLTPPKSGAGEWVKTVLYSFPGGSNGGRLAGPLAIAANGAIFGTRIEGGDGCGSVGCGAVFELAPPATPGQPWTFSTLYQFTGGKDGEHPSDGVVLDKQGNLYGPAFYQYGVGKTSKSLIFKLTPPKSGTGLWSQSVLYHFDSFSNCYSSGPLAVDADGALYGAFSAYASYNSGCIRATTNDTGTEYVYQLVPSKSDPNVWVKTEMHRFTYSDLPAGYELTAPLTVDAAGNVYGATVFGGLDNDPQRPGDYGGTVFVLQPRAGSVGKWNYKLLFDFDALDMTTLNNKTGSNPNGGLVLDSAGNLYGTTLNGGGAHRGVVFRLTP